MFIIHVGREDSCLVNYYVALKGIVNLVFQVGLRGKAQNAHLLFAPSVEIP